MTSKKRTIKLKKLTKMKNVWGNNTAKKKRTKSTSKGQTHREYNNRKVDRAKGILKFSEQR